MNDTELNELDRLLSKLQAHLKHRFVISCGLQDSFQIGIYDNFGICVKQAQSETVEKTVKEILRLTNV